MHYLFSMAAQAQDYGGGGGGDEALPLLIVAIGGFIGALVLGISLTRKGPWKN